jgi:4-hydroxy-tetrahydrodipicolinate synthase
MPHFSGVYAALLTPRNSAGDLDLDSFRGQLNAPAASSLTGYAINGATAEFTFSTEDELNRILAATREAAPAAELLAGIGACDVRGAVARGRIAAQAGAAAVLLPMPSFFPYRQDDLAAFSTAVADALTIPVLLYNLPQFTTGLDPQTTLDLIRDHANIIGVKDSSGSLDTVQLITGSKLACARIIGNDGALAAALEQGLCDGVVSGVACTLPELITALFAAAPGTGDFAHHQQLLDEFIAQLGTLPTPWGLKVTSSVRGFTRESYPFPLSPQRMQETAQLRTWFKEWLGSNVKH